MFRLFEGDSADEVWQSIATAFRDSVGIAQQPSRAGSTMEILHAAISIKYPLQRWVVSRTPPLNPAFALAEIIWLLCGRNDAAFLNYFNAQLPRYAGNGDTYHGSYGFRLRKHFGPDQLERAYESLSRKPHSRQVVLQIWDPRVDFPLPDGSETSLDVPCNISSMLKIRNDRLEWTQVIRSNDLFRGLPYNFIQFTTLQEVLAGWIGVEPGAFHTISDSLHVYDDSAASIRASMPVQVEHNCDSLALPKRESEEAFRELAKKVEMIIDRNVNLSEMLGIAHSSGFSNGYRNILCLLSAEGARKRNGRNIAQQIMADCTNPALRQVYERWITRLSHHK